LAEKARANMCEDPKEREEILRRLREKIRKIVKCKNCFRIMSTRIIQR